MPLFFVKPSISFLITRREKKHHQLTRPFVIRLNLLPSFFMTSLSTLLHSAPNTLAFWFFSTRQIYFHLEISALPILFPGPLFSGISTLSLTYFLDFYSPQLKLLPWQFSVATQLSCYALPCLPPLLSSFIFSSTYLSSLCLHFLPLRRMYIT